MEDDSLNVKDDHNHNHCSSSSSKARMYLSSQLSDATSVPQSVCLPVPGGEAGTRRGKVWSGCSGGSKFMDSDSGSESSEVSETDCTASSTVAEGKFTLDTTSKFRKFAKSKRCDRRAWCPDGTQLRYPCSGVLRLKLSSANRIYLSVIAPVC